MDNNSELNHQWVDERVSQLNASSEWKPDVDRAFARFEGRSKRAPGLNWAIAAAIFAGIGAAVLAFPAPRVFASRCVDACESLFLGKPPLADPSMRAGYAPDFTLNDSNGAALRLSDYKGKVVLLNFWATWCGPCKAEIPWFIEFEQAHKNQGFAVIGISMDDDGWKSVKPYIEAKKITYRVAVDDGSVAQKYGGVDSLPMTILIDREGRITARHIGLVSKSAYEHEIAGLLKR
jgi:thiol-disulfide isomerase/thioredoxin